MAVAAVLDIARLDEGYILAPERYDPRRRRAEEDGPRLGDFVNIRRDQVSGKTAGAHRYLILDTGDAQNGIITTAKAPRVGAEIRSAKKRIHPNQVIISRLRPYLRQIAWVDAGLTTEQGPDVALLCSTEFFVLDSVNEASIAFLTPFLLSPPVQAILAAAQEGGHHPRFNEHTLMTLRLPARLVEQRAELSARFEKAVAQARQAHGAMRRCVAATFADGAATFDNEASALGERDAP